MKVTQKKIFFLALFSILGFVSLQIPFNKLAGSNISFTLFDFFAPIAGAFLGPLYGIISVLGVEVVNMILKQNPWDTASIIRLFPTLFAVYYFATLRKNQKPWILAVPLISIIVFLAHPYGRQVPQYTLFWLIPLIAYRLKNNLYLRSLGATFTAHAVGGGAWIWVFNLKAAVWQTLIPVVIAERILFAAGIASAYLVTKYTFRILAEKKFLPKLDIAHF